MRICFISSDIYTYINQVDNDASGGAERQQYIIANELLERGDEVATIVGDFGQPPYKRQDGFEIWKGCPGSISSITSIPASVISLWRAMKNADSDMYYIRGSPRLFVISTLLSRFLRKRVLFCVANESDVDLEYLEQKYGSLFVKTYSNFIRRADIVVAQTATQQQMLQENFGVDSTIIPNCYDLPPESELLDHDSREYVLWVGRSNKEKKKPMRFLELAKSAPEIQFVMVAQPSNDGSHHEHVMAEAANVDNLRFVDTVRPDKIHKYYRKASLLVNTSDYEGFPNTFLEAWRYETPVVSLYYSHDDAFTAGNAGFRSGSIDQLRKDVAELCNNDETRAKMGTDARAFLKDNYLLEKVVDQYEILFENEL
ncbi:glycosyltransferase family 4 protein [Natronorubrum daqingense]|uniref:Glycosyltransferase involved in cell wall bisynthesis n=1 Tax=Natronorubrum daqingense TaxID=588898 RepID=A0A1N7BT28_9EURY|nr:glycosyltransferase family 4 protein [Natronorubrum daqingense]APX96588.1 hypothetical protein BB347_08140 [Natronorubrum daqingense]SIR54460.1 Glycosyltransferase involved in cell wall bisynthesis [Natronorubrum daqingense]